MRYAILGELLTTLGVWAFNGCKALETLVIKATTPPSLYNTAVLGDTNNCPIYVPDASVEAYKTATNWSSYASRIKGISELPIDNPTLYDEIKDYLEGQMSKKKIIYRKNEL